VNGCFWHGHEDCRRATLPATRNAFWREKIARNVQRDRTSLKRLTEQGWRVLTLWTCELKDLGAVVQLVADACSAPAPDEKSQPRPAEAAKGSRRSIR
jgi:DNA mismatch endonuclease, patch repair protein